MDQCHKWTNRNAYFSESDRNIDQNVSTKFVYLRTLKKQNNNNLLKPIREK